jgi:lipopolysaccharide/colanic/teichoic acid biosynthesis glycosyltransferase
MQKEIQFTSLQGHTAGILRPAAAPRMYYLLKRAADILLAFFLLALLLPIMTLVVLLIIVYSPGPIFYSQERVGARLIHRNGRWYWKQENFRCYKFRTMKTNADSSLHKEYVQALIQNDEEKMAAIQGQTTPVRKLLHDPRIIRPGRLLRKFSLDELPQLWNVLRGDMSMIGPRPAIPYEVELYKHWYGRRLEAQPGITGLQQVKARCNTDFETQIKFDIEYVDNQSLWLDIKIAFLTPWAILTGRGAG